MGEDMWRLWFTKLLLVLAVVHTVGAQAGIEDGDSLSDDARGSRIERHIHDGELLNDEDKALRIQRDVQGVTTVLLVSARPGKSAPPVGLLTKTARTFVQDGASTEFATQVLGTTLDNGRLYARILSTSSRVFYEKEPTPDPPSPYVVYPSRAPEDDWQLRVALDSAPIKAIKEIEAPRREEYEESSSSSESEEQSGRSSSRLDELARENDVFNKRELAADSHRFKPAKIRPADNLPTYTIKHDYITSPFDTFEDDQPKNVRPRIPKIFKPQPKIPPQRKLEPKPLATVTYHGFADFTTTVGDTVIVFSPSTSPAPVGRPATTIKGDATLRPDDGIAVMISPTNVLSGQEKTVESSHGELGNVESVPKRGSADPMLDLINRGNIQPSVTEELDIESFRKSTEPLLLVPDIETGSLKPTGLLKVVDSTTSLDGTTTHYKSLIYGTYLGTNYAQIIHTSSNVYFFPDEATATYDSEDTTLDYGATGTTADEAEQDTTLEMSTGTTPRIITTSEDTPPEMNELTTPMRDTTDSVLTTLKDILESARRVLGTTESAVPSFDDEIPNDIVPGDHQGRSIKGGGLANNLENQVEKGHAFATANTEEESTLVTRIIPSTVYKTFTYFTTFFLSDQETSIRSREVVSSEVSYLTELINPSVTTTAILPTAVHEPTTTEKTSSSVSEQEEEQTTKQDEEIELIFKTFYTTYTYLTTFYQEDTSVVFSREAVDTNVITQTVGPNGVSAVVAGLFDKDESVLIAPTKLSDSILPSTTITIPEQIEDNRDEVTERNPTTLAETTEGGPTTYQDQDTTVNQSVPTEAGTTVDDFEDTKQPAVELEPSPTPALPTEAARQQVKTYYTTFTYFTTIFDADETEIETRTKVFTNVVTENVEPTAVLPVTYETVDPTTPKSEPAGNPGPSPEILAYLELRRKQKADEDALKKAQDEAVTKAEETTTVTEGKTEPTTEMASTLDERPTTENFFRAFEVNGQVTPNTPIEGEVLGSMVTDVISSSSSGGGTVLDVLDKRNAVPEDQELSESNHHDVEPAPTLLLQTSYTTFTYFTTMYKGDESSVMSRLETVTNVATETIRPTDVMPSDTSTLPVTYFTTYTYRTTFYKDGDTTTTSREETVSNVVTPGVSPTPTIELGVIMTYRPSAIEEDPIEEKESKVTADNEVTGGSDVTTSESSATEKTDTTTAAIVTSIPTEQAVVDATSVSLEPTTVYVTHTYFTRSYTNNETILHSRLETVTSVSVPDGATQVPTGRAIGGPVYPPVQTLLTEDKPVTPSKVTEPPKTGLLSTVRSSEVHEGTTTHYTTDVYGRYIDGLYAQVVESSTSIETPALPSSSTATPVLPTGVLSLNKGSVVDADEVTTVYFTTKQTGAYIDGLYAKVIESTSSTKIDEERKASIAPTHGHRTGLVRLISGQIENNGTTTVYQSKVIGTSIEGRYAQIIESTFSFLAASPTVNIAPTSTTPPVASTGVPEISPSPAVIQSSLSDDPTTETPEQDEDSEQNEEDEEEGEEDEDGQSSKKKSRLTFSTRRRTFTPVIRPFASRNRPTFNPKRKGAQGATTITRTDITPTITATLAGKGNRFASSRGRITSPIGPYSSTISASGSRRFSGRRGSPTTSSTYTSSVAGSSRGRAQSRISPSSVFQGNRRGPTSVRGSSSRAAARGPSSIYPGASSRYRPGIRPSSTLLRGQTTAKHDDQENDANEFTTTTLITDETAYTDEFDGGETVTAPLQTTTESSRRSTNPLLRFRRPLNYNGAARAGTTPRPSTTTKRSGNLSRSSSPTVPRVTSTRTNGRTLAPISTRTRPGSTGLFPPRGLFGRKQELATDEQQSEPNEDFDGEDEENFEDEPVEEIADNDYEGSEHEDRTSLTGVNRRSGKAIRPTLQMKPFAGRSRRVRRQASQLRSLTNRFRRPSSLKSEDKPETAESVHSKEESGKTAGKPVSRYNNRARSLTTSRPSSKSANSPERTSAESSESNSSQSKPRSRAKQQNGERNSSSRIKPSPASSNGRQFTLREKDNPSSSRPSYKRPSSTTSRTNGRTSGKSTESGRVRPPRLRSSQQETTPNSRRVPPSRASSRSSSRNGSSRRGSPQRGRGSHEDIRESPTVYPDFDGTITVTHYVPTEVTIPVVNNGVTEHRNIITAQASTQVLAPSQYSTVTGGDGRPLVVIVSEATGTNLQGQTEVTRFLLHETPTTRISHTLTTLGGRRASQSVIVPTKVYSVENVVSTVQPTLAGNAPLANILLSQLLLGQLAQTNPLLQPQGTPTTQYNTRTTSYVTTITKHQSTVIPLTFRGKEILTTLVDSSTDVVTATEFITDTVVVTPTAALPAANLNSLLLLLQQPQPQQTKNSNPLLDPVFAAPPFTQSNTLPGEVERRHQPADSDYKHDSYEYSDEEEDEDVVEYHHKSSRPRNGRGRSHEKKDEHSSALKGESSVVTLYVSGRRPGEFSTVLSTVRIGESASASRRRRDAADGVVEVRPSIPPSLHAGPEAVAILAGSEDSADSHAPTQSLESVVGDYHDELAEREAAYDKQRVLDDWPRVEEAAARTYADEGEDYHEDTPRKRVRIRVPVVRRNGRQHKLTVVRRRPLTTRTRDLPASQTSHSPRRIVMTRVRTLGPVSSTAVEEPEEPQPEIGRHKVTITRRRRIQPTPTPSTLTRGRGRITRKKLIAVRPVQPTPTFAVITTGFFTAPSTEYDEDYATVEQQEEEEGPGHTESTTFTPNLEEMPNLIDSKPNEDESESYAPREVQPKLPEVSTSEAVVIITDNFFFPASDDEQGDEYEDEYSETTTNVPEDVTESQTPRNETETTPATGTSSDDVEENVVSDKPDNSTKAEDESSTTVKTTDPSSSDELASAEVTAGSSKEEDQSEEVSTTASASEDVLTSKEETITTAKSESAERTSEDDTPTTEYTDIRTRKEEGRASDETDDTTEVMVEKTIDAERTSDETDEVVGHVSEESDESREDTSEETHEAKEHTSQEDDEKEEDTSHETDKAEERTTLSATVETTTSAEETTTINVPEEQPETTTEEERATTTQTIDRTTQLTIEKPEEKNESKEPPEQDTEVNDENVEMSTEMATDTATNSEEESEEPSSKHIENDVKASPKVTSGPVDENVLTVQPIEPFADPDSHSVPPSVIDILSGVLPLETSGPASSESTASSYTDDVDVPSVIPLDVEYTRTPETSMSSILEASPVASPTTTSISSPTPEDIEAGLADDLYLSLSRPDFPEILPSKPISRERETESTSDLALPLSTSVYYTETVVTSTRLKTYTYIVTQLNERETKVTSSTTVRPRVTTLTLTVPVTVTVTPTVEPSAISVSSLYNPVSAVENESRDEEGRRFNLATRVMSNGVEVIVAGPTPALRWENSIPQPTLTLSDAVVMMLPQDKPNEFVTKTCTTTFTYLSTITKDGTTTVSTEQQVVANTATEERHRKAGSETAAVTLEASPTLRTEVFKTTYTYLTLNTDHPNVEDALESSTKVITNTVTAPQHYLDMILEPSEAPRPETNTYFSTRVLEKTFMEDGRTKVETTGDTVTQLIVTESAPPPRPTSVTTTLTALDNTEGTMTDVTRTYYITYTYFNTFLEKGSTVVRTNVATSTNVVLEQVPVKKTTTKSIPIIPTPEPIQIFATKTYLTTYTYFTTLLQAGPDGEISTTVSSHSHIVENVVTESIAPSLLDAGYMNALLTTAHHSDPVKNVVTGSTIIFFDEEDQIDPTTTSSFPEASTMPEPEKDETISPSTISSESAEPTSVVGGTNSKLVEQGSQDGNVTAAVSADGPQNKRPSAQTGGDLQVSNLLSLGSLGINGLSALGPVITAMAGLLQGKTTATRRNDTVPLIESQEATTQRSPIYIPVAEFADGDIETAESQHIGAHLANLNHNYIAETRHKVASSLADGIPISPGEVITANSDVIIGKPGKMAPRPPQTFLSDEEHIGMKPPPLPVPNIPVHPVLEVLEGGHDDSQTQQTLQGHKGPQVQIVPARQVYEEHLKIPISIPHEAKQPQKLHPVQSAPPKRIGSKQGILENDPLLKPPERPNVEQYANPNLSLKAPEWNPEKFRGPWSSKDPLTPPLPPPRFDQKIYSGKPAVDKSWPAVPSSEEQKRNPWSQKDPLLPDASVGIQTSESKPVASEPIVHQVPHVIDRSTGQPLLVNIQPSQVANVVIPQDGTQALIFGDTSEPHISGQYFDDPSPYPEPEVGLGFVGIQSVEDLPQYASGKDPSEYMVPPSPPVNFKPLSEKAGPSARPTAIPLSPVRFDYSRPQEKLENLSGRPEKNPSDFHLIKRPDGSGLLSGQGHVHTEILVHHRPETVNLRPQALPHPSVLSHVHSGHQLPPRAQLPKVQKPNDPNTPPRRTEVSTSPSEVPHRYIFFGKPDSGNEIGINTNWKSDKKPPRILSNNRPWPRPLPRPTTNRPLDRPMYVERPSGHPLRPPGYTLPHRNLPKTQSTFVLPHRPPPNPQIHHEPPRILTDIGKDVITERPPFGHHYQIDLQARPPHFYLDKTDAPKVPISESQTIRNEEHVPTGAVEYHNPSHPKIQSDDRKYYAQPSTIGPGVQNLGQVVPQMEEGSNNWQVNTQTEKTILDSDVGASEHVKYQDEFKDDVEGSQSEDEQGLSHSENSQSSNATIKLNEPYGNVMSVNTVVGKPLEANQSITYGQREKPAWISQGVPFGHKSDGYPIRSSPYGPDMYNTRPYDMPIVQGKPFGVYNGHVGPGAPYGYKRKDGKPEFEIVQGVPSNYYDDKKTSFVHKNPQKEQTSSPRPYVPDDTIDLKPPAIVPHFVPDLERPGRPHPRPHTVNRPEIRPVIYPRPEIVTKLPGNYETRPEHAHKRPGDSRPDIVKPFVNQTLNHETKLHAMLPTDYIRDQEHSNWNLGTKDPSVQQPQEPIGHNPQVNKNEMKQSESKNGTVPVLPKDSYSGSAGTMKDGAEMNRPNVPRPEYGTKTRIHSDYPHILTKPKPPVPGPITITSGSTKQHDRPNIKFSMPVEAMGEEVDSKTQTERPPSMLVTKNNSKNNKQNEESLETAYQTNFATSKTSQNGSRIHQSNVKRPVDSLNQDTMKNVNIPSRDMMPPPLRPTKQPSKNEQEGLKPPPPPSDDVVGLTPPPLDITTTDRPMDDRFALGIPNESGLKPPPKYIPLKESSVAPLPGVSMVPPSQRPSFTRPFLVELLSQDMVPPPPVMKTTRPLEIATVRPAVAVSGSIQIATAVATSHIPVVQDIKSKIPIIHGTVDLPIVLDLPDILRPVETKMTEHVSIYTVRPFDTKPASRITIQPTMTQPTNTVMPTKLRPVQVDDVQLSKTTSTSRKVEPTRLHTLEVPQNPVKRPEHPVFLESSYENVLPSMAVEPTESLTHVSSTSHKTESRPTVAKSEITKVLGTKTTGVRRRNETNVKDLPTAVTRVDSSITRVSSTLMESHVNDRRNESTSKTTMDVLESEARDVPRNRSVGLHMKPKEVTRFRTSTVTRTETSVLGSPPTTRTLLLTHTMTSTIVETVTETLLRPTSVVATVTSTILQSIVTRIPGSYENAVDNDSIFVVMSDHKPPGPGAEEVEAEYGEEEISRDEQDPAGNEIHRVLAGGVLGAPVASLQPVGSQCTPECKASKAEVCAEVGTEMKCVCRPGFARMFPDRPCKPTYTYTLRIGLDRFGRESVNYGTALNDTSSTAYKRLIGPTKDALDRTLMQSDLRDIYRGLRVAGFTPDPTKVEFHVQLSDNANETRLKEVLRKYLVGSNYSLGGTEVYASKNLDSVDAIDFNECANEESGPHHDCSPNAACFNLRGSYQCSCMEGWADLSENPVYPGRTCSQAPLGCSSCNNKGHCVTNTLGQEVCECFPWHSGQRCQVNLKVLLIALVTTGAILLGVLVVCVGMACFRHPGRRRKTGDRRAMIPGTGGDTSSEGSVTDLAIPHHVPHVLPPPPPMIAPLPPMKRPARKIAGKPRHPPRKATMVPAAVPMNDEQRDRSLTVMIPRAKYRSAPQSPQNYKSAMSTFSTEEHKLINYLDNGTHNTGNRRQSVTSTKDCKEAELQVVRTQSTPSGALVSAGFQVSATVTRNVDAQSTLARSCGETTVEPATKVLRSGDLQADLGSTLARSCGETTIQAPTKLLRLDLAEAGSTLARSCGETTIQPPTKVAATRRNSVKDARDNRDTRDSASEGHTMAERDLGSTLRLPAQHPPLYSPDRTSDRESNFDSL